MSLCVGLTGGIASGKSTVGQLFETLGVPVIDADQVARDVVAPGSPGLRAVAEHFGAAFITPQGELDRRRMREHVFAAPDQRKALESLLHPLIREALRAWRDALTTPYGILMIPILREGGFDSLVEHIVVVDVARETQRERLMARDDIDATLADNMLNAQADRADRLAMADDVIDNSGAPDNLPPQVEALHHKLLSLAHTRQV